MSSKQGADVFSMKLDELEQRVSKALDHLRQIEELLPGLIELGVAGRKHAIGRLRDGEDEALLSVFDAAEAHPSRFQALADDGDTGFETVHARAALARRALLGKVASPMSEIERRLSDTQLALGSRAREIGIAAYVVGRLNAQADPALAGAMDPAIAFFTAPPRAKKKRAR
jgi:hypothetical protein